MPQIIEVPGHGRVEFPDGMSDAEIVSAIKRNAQQPKRPNEAAMNPEANVWGMRVDGEASSGFNPAAAIIKAGEVADNIGKGATQLMRGPADWIKQKMGGAPDPVLEQIAQERAMAKQPMKDLAEVHPGSTFIGEAGMYAVAPNKAGPVMAAMEYGSPTERVVRGGAAYLGNKIGEKLGQAPGRAVHPVRPGELSETQMLANEAADRLGVKLSAGEATGNRTMKWAESTTADLPGAAGMATKRHSANAKAMNAAALRQLGQGGDEITEAVLAKARADTSDIYKRVLDPAKIELDNTFRAEVKAISGSKVLRELRDEQVDSILNQFKDMPQGKIAVSGEWFQQNKTALDAEIRAAYTNGQPGKARALEGFEGALDRAATRSLPKTDRADYAKAGRQWATLRQLETGKVVENGNVMPGRLDQALNTRYKGAYKEGRIDGDLSDVARLASTLRGPPNSGTLPRQFYAGGIGGAALFEPATALGLLAGPATVQGLLTSPLMRKYMSPERSLLNVSPDLDELLKHLGGTAGLLGAVGATP